MSIEEGELDHQISVIDVSDDERTCGLNVNGDISLVAINQITKIDGIIIKVLAVDIVSSATQDTDLCEISFYCETPICTDSDGTNIYMPGITYGFSGRVTSDFKDFCSDSDAGIGTVSSGRYVHEYFCENNMVVSQTYYCQNGCSNGACLSAAQAVKCADSDGGKNYGVKGSTKLADGSGLNDDCRRQYVNGAWVNTGEILEAVCSEDGLTTTYTSYQCPFNSCEDSVCAAATANPEDLVKEKVTCVFDNSNAQQECYAVGKNGCVGTTSCNAGVIGKRGEAVTWKSTCGGYAYTMMDGVDEYAKFSCTGQTNTAVEQVNENTLKTISSVWSDRKEYNVGERIVIYAKVVDSDGTPSTPEEGTSVGFGLNYNAMNIKTPFSVRYNPSSGYYEAETTVPAIKTAIVWVTASRGFVNVNNDDYLFNVVDGYTATTPVVSSDPVCGAIGTRSEGWKTLQGIVYDNCNGCKAVCRATGTKSEGWYSSCTGKLIAYGQCSSATSATPVVGSTQAVEPTATQSTQVVIPTEAEGSTTEEKKITKEKLENPAVSCMNGCAADSKCLPFGTKMLVDEKPNFCDISQSFEPQKNEKEACQNNYECASNQCSNGLCVDLQKQLEETQSLLKKVMGWLKKFFGAEE
ncbi:hypothetical protein COV19_04000 [Candidatus Woesearchaeota archaeon CG10_big_fil_rev_8_21_14_0_10_44_13]|nr:MAG: hypothetical protein COV19_04000 [Candidatus Woesearchaeota archaeon CG10_big_fil_rev_8_21_14_0_10_44_13]